MTDTYLVVKDYMKLMHRANTAKSISVRKASRKKALDLLNIMTAKALKQVYMLEEQNND
jgi:hypothetical protein